MKIYNDLTLKFEDPLWALDPELALIDTILDNNPELYELVRGDILSMSKNNDLGRKDGPTVEQVVRAALYKEQKKVDYRGLEYAEYDSRIFALFVKLEGREPFSFEVFYKFISKIKANSLKNLMVAINKIAIGMGLENGKKVRTDTTVVKSPIHYPTNNALMWDCIKESHRLLKKIAVDMQVKIRNYKKKAKKNYYQINVKKSESKRKELFEQQLKIFRMSINQVHFVIEELQKVGDTNLSGKKKEIELLKELLPVMEKVYDISNRHELLGEEVPSEEKIYSIYERHTDIIVKGGNVEFGHKINLATGKSNLILDCEVLKGNPKDTKIYKEVIDCIEEKYGIIPRDMATDGGFASLDNQSYAKNKGVVNIVFNKIVGSLKNIVTSVNMESRLNKWRSGMEGVISNWKRGFEMFLCEWKGEHRFSAKVLWSIIAYNIRVMTRLVLSKMELQTRKI